MNVREEKQTLHGIKEKAMCKSQQRPTFSTALATSDGSCEDNAEEKVSNTAKDSGVLTKQSLGTDKIQKGTEVFPCVL